MVKSETVGWPVSSCEFPLAGEARLMAEEVAGKVPRAGRKPASESTYLRTDRPKVAEFVAGVAVKNALDMERAVEELKPDLSPMEVAVTAHKHFCLNPRSIVCFNPE